MKKAIVIFYFLILNIASVIAQDAEVNNLIAKISSEKNESLRIDEMVAYFYEIAESDPLRLLKGEEKILMYARKNNDQIIEALSLSYIGYCFRNVDTEKSFEYALKADELALKTGNDKCRVETKIIIGLCYKDLQNYTKSIEIFKEANVLAEKVKYDIGNSWTCENLAELHLWINDINSGLKYAQKGFELSTAINSESDIPYIFIHLGFIQGKLGNPELSKSYYDKSLEFADKFKSPKVANWSYTSQAKFFYESGQKDSAAFYAKKAIEVVKNTVFENYKLRPAQMLLDIYRETNIDSAFRYSEMYRIANDSLFSNKKIQRTQLMAFDNQIKERELAAEKLKLEEERKQNVQLAFIAFGIISFILLFLILSRSVITNTRVIEILGVIALLIVFEFLNLLLHPFLEKITHHSPILMLLGLVCIAAILVPLHHKLEHWATHKIIEKNKEIRLASAKKTIDKLDVNPGKDNS